MYKYPRDPLAQASRGIGLFRFTLRARNIRRQRHMKDVCSFFCKISPGSFFHRVQMLRQPRSFVWRRRSDIPSICRWTLGSLVLIQCCLYSQLQCCNYISTILSHNGEHQSHKSPPCVSTDGGDYGRSMLPKMCLRSGKVGYNCLAMYCSMVNAMFTRLFNKVFHQSFSCLRFKGWSKA